MTYRKFLTGAAIVVAVAASAWFTGSIQATDEMPGFCDEFSMPKAGGGWTNGHKFGSGAPYSCGTHGCHGDPMFKLCFQHGHAGSH
jgi:hypothetical protein